MASLRTLQNLGLVATVELRLPLMLSEGLLFFFNDTATTEIYTLSLHDALPISTAAWDVIPPCAVRMPAASIRPWRSEEHTSELQSRRDLVCRLLLEKKKKKISRHQRRRNTPA